MFGKQFVIYVTNRPETLSELRTAESHLAVEFKQVASILELCNELATSDQAVSLVTFDEPLLFENPNLSVFDITNLVQNFAKASKQQTVPNMAVYVDNKSSPKHIEQLLDTEIKGFVPSIGLFGVDDMVVAIAELLSNRLNVPRKLVDWFLHPHKSKLTTQSSSIVLTRRQTQILQLITTRGASNKLIARTLKISESTVKLHISAILKKYGVRNRTQLALCSLGNGRM